MQLAARENLGQNDDAVRMQEELEPVPRFKLQAVTKLLWESSLALLLLGVASIEGVRISFSGGM